MASLNNDTSASSGPLDTFMTLRNGVKMPMYIFGTYKIGALPKDTTRPTTVGRSTKEVLLDALKIGYRCFDCAGNYENEKGIGEAIKESGVDRKNIFLASKIRQRVVYEGANAVRTQVEKTLSDLGTSYIDLMYIHWPVPAESPGQIPKHIGCYKELEKLVEEGMVKCLGMSNYTIQDYEDLKKHMKIPPVCNQFEVNPFTYRKNTIKYFLENGVKIIGYRVLAQGDEMDNATLLRIATKHNVSVAQVLLKWCLQHDIGFVARSQSMKHMRVNINLSGITLDEDDMSILDNKTTPHNLKLIQEKYEECILRETPWVGKLSSTGFIGWVNGTQKIGHIVD